MKNLEFSEISFLYPEKSENYLVEFFIGIQFFQKSSDNFTFIF